MHGYYRWLGLVVCVWLLGNFSAWAEVYKIREIRRNATVPRDNIGPWEEMLEEKIDEKTKVKKKVKIPVFVPFIEVKLEVNQQIFTEGQDFKIYGYDKDRNIVGEPLIPSNPSEKGRNVKKFPVKFETGQAYSLYFKIPEALRKQSANLTYLVVLGDKDEVTVEFYPKRGDSPEFYDFWEKDIYLKPNRKETTGKPKMAPVMQHVVLTKNPKQPKITLFFCPPEGIEDASELNGVIAYCMLGDSAEHLIRKIQRQDPDDGINYLRAFAQRNKLGLLMWGSTRLWDPQKNYTEYERKQYRELDEAFDAVANAWEEGLIYLHKTYGIPKEYLLLEGFSGSAQWAHRLALRKPEYFLAVHIHIPSSFDKPRMEANKILWCVTTGELEGGYESSKIFYADCRALDFPIIYKAIPKLGHQDSVIAYDFRDRFFEFALSLRDKRKAYDEQLKNQRNTTNNGPWVEEFRNAPYVGDILNQSLYPISEVDMIPENLRVYLPTQAIADAWNQSLL